MAENQQTAHMKRSLLAVYVLFIVWGLAGGGAFGQSYPSKPVHLVVPFTPGGGTDIVARIVGQRLSERFGQPVVVENRPGAAATLGTEYTARSAPDGYTLQVGSTSEIGIGASLHKRVSYNVLRDLVVVTPLASTPMVLVVHPSLPVKTAKDLVALAKVRPGELNFASAGAGTGNHMSGELFNYLTQVKIVHIPYKGAAPALADVVGGQVHIMFSTVPAATGLMKAARLRALGVSSAKRYPALPDVPTLIEAGIPGYEVEYWYGFLAPAATPKDVIARIHSDTSQVLRMPETAASLDAQGLQPILKSQSEFAAFVKADIERWAVVVKASGAVGF